MKLKYNKWYPINKYYNNLDNMDWALVQFKETKTSFLPLPIIAEYVKRDKVWRTKGGDDRYFCELCDAIAFMLWKPYKERNKKIKEWLNDIH